MKFIYSLLFIFLGLCTTACIEDGVDTSPSSQPEFSCDTLKMGVAFTGQGTPTRSFTVRNPHDKILSISSISLRGGDKGFRLNVDGVSGRSFQNVEVRGNDSIYVFVEATVPQVGSGQPRDVEDILDFVTNGVTRSVVLSVTGQDVTRHDGVTVQTDATWEADQPYQIYDSLVVAHGATLTLKPGVRIYFHDKAYMKVDGKLVCGGSVDAPIVMSGDRMDNIVGDLAFDLLAAQWQGITFGEGSRGNTMSHTEVRNTVTGLLCQPGSELELLNCNIRNASACTLESNRADIRAYGTVFSEAVMNVVQLNGGTVEMNHCTLANYYLRKYPTLPLMGLLWTGAIDDEYEYDDEYFPVDAPYMKADFSNCIFYGLSADLSIGDLAGAEVFYRSCLFKSAGQDDDNFINCLWDTDPLYRTVREDYIFDYRLADESPAATAADPALMSPKAATDFYGVARDVNALSMGAYQYVYVPENE